MPTNSTETGGSLSRNFDGFNGRVLLTAVVIFFIILIAWITLHCLNRFLLGRHVMSDVISYQTNSGRQDNYQPSHSGLHPSVIAALPVMAYQKGGMVVECVVCLGQLEEGENVRIFPRCQHLFHVDCIDMWLFTHSSCPVCRANAEPPDSFRFPESSMGVAMAGLANSKEVGSASCLRSPFRGINGEDLSERNSQSSIEVIQDLERQ